MVERLSCDIFGLYLYDHLSLQTPIGGLCPVQKEPAFG